MIGLIAAAGVLLIITSIGILFILFCGASVLNSCIITSLCCCFCIRRRKKKSSVQPAPGHERTETQTEKSLALDTFSQDTIS